MYTTPHPSMSLKMLKILENIKTLEREVGGGTNSFPERVLFIVSAQAIIMSILVLDQLRKLHWYIAIKRK